MGKLTVLKKVESRTDFQTGEIMQQTELTQYREKAEEPNYIKLYVKTVLTFNDLSVSLDGVLCSLLSRMTYADINSVSGGQIIYLNKALKTEIAKDACVSVKRIDQALTGFVKTKIFKRIATGTYQVNPNIFGKGDWGNIRELAATFNFNSGEVEIKTNESVNSENEMRATS